jgi:transmembrane sensor
MIKGTKQLAICYFEGKISREEEKTLFDFIEQSEENLVLFRSWETEWREHHEVDAETEKAWQSLESRMMMGMDEKPAKIINLWRRIAAIAAVVLLIVGTAVVTRYVTSNAPESYYAVTAPQGNKSQLVLPDGSKVWLNAGSTLRYSTQFSQTNRRVELEGEGYFEVTKHDGAEFIVRTGGYDVVVKGTHFDVSAYKGDQYITTALMQGSVMINRGEDHLLMKPGDIVKLDTSTGELIKSTFSTSTNAWMQNVTDYDEITLNDFAKVLSRQYAVDIHIQSATLRQTKFSITLRNQETIDEVLDALKRVMNMKVRRDGKDIYISE